MKLAPYPCKRNTVIAMLLLKAAYHIERHNKLRDKLRVAAAIEAANGYQPTN